MEKIILYEIFCVVLRFPRYILFYIAENKFPLGQCVQCTKCVYFLDYCYWFLRILSLQLFCLQFPSLTQLVPCPPLFTISNRLYPLQPVCAGVPEGGLRLHRVHLHPLHVGRHHVRHQAALHFPWRGSRKGQVG